MDNDCRRRRCAIIGAGASGLPSARWALAYGFEPVVFERDDQIGGLWHFKPQETEMASVMRSTIINTSKEMLAYSDFPPPEHFANFMHNSKMLEYFSLYVDHHNLQKHIRFRHQVTNICRADDYAETGRWCVDYRILGDENTCTEIFDCVLLCQGHHARPNLAGTDWPGREEFSGRVLHTHEYKDSRGFEGSRTVIVGVGSSAIDAAVELSHVCKEVFISTRRGTWVSYRVGDHGFPADMLDHTRLNELYLPMVMPMRWLESRVIKKIQRRFDHAKYGLMPHHSLFSQHATISDELPNRLISGTVLLRPDIERLTDGDTVVWADGQRTTGVDNIILGTGYTYNLDVLEGGGLVKVERNYAPLYMYMFPPALADHNTLAMIGHVQVVGPLPPTAEMQARLFFEVMIRRVRLPSRVKMLDDVRRRRDEMTRRYVQSDRHTIQVDFLSYLNELAGMVGCQPNILRYVFTDPRLAYTLVFGAGVSYGYRLNGPHPWSKARRAVLTAHLRAERGLCPTTMPKSVMKVDAARRWTVRLAVIGALAAGLAYNATDYYRNGCCCALSRLLHSLPITSTTSTTH